MFPAAIAGLVTLPACSPRPAPNTSRITPTHLDRGTRSLAFQLLQGIGNDDAADATNTIRQCLDKFRGDKHAKQPES